MLLCHRKQYGQLLEAGPMHASPLGLGGSEDVIFPIFGASATSHHLHMFGLAGVSLIFPSLYLRSFGIMIPLLLPFCVDWGWDFDWDLSAGLWWHRWESVVFVRFMLDEWSKSEQIPMWCFPCFDLGFLLLCERCGVCLRGRCTVQVVNKPNLLSQESAPLVPSITKSPSSVN